MRTSSKGAAFIAAHEGIVTRAYKDSAGVWTIGVGHTASAGAPKPARGMTITKADALVLLDRDLAKFDARVDKALPGIGQAAHDGATSFDFNTGAILKATWVNNYLAGNYAAAKTGLAAYNKAGGKVVAGLVRRRADEQRLIFNGDYGVVDPSILGTASAPSASQTTDEVKDYQQQLAALGYYAGKIDGIAGPATKAAVVSYQKGHPDLVDDGIVGPATRASLERDVKAKSAPVQAAASGVTSAVATGAAVTAAGGNNAVMWAVLAGVVLAALIGGFVYLKNRR